MRIRKNFVNIIIVAILFFTGKSAFASRDFNYINSFADIIEPLMPSVVNIYTVKYHNRANGSNLPELIPFDGMDEFFREFNVPFAFDLYSNRASSLGSGFIIDPSGLIVTNYHVIAGSDEINVKLSDNTEFPARIIGRDPKTDLALIKIETDDELPFVSFGDSSKARVGDVVIAIGNSLGFGGTVTSGIISSKGRDLGSGADELVDDFIQTDAAINTGNSGGPLFNIEGDVIGINTSIPAVSRGTNVGIGFAIPSNRARAIVDELKISGKITRGRLDIIIQEINAQIAKALNIEYNYGVLVVDAKIGGAGYKAGLKRGDLIIAFNDKKILNSRKLQLCVAETTVGDEVKLTIIRDGKIIDLTAVIEITGSNLIAEDMPQYNSSFNINDENLIEKSNVTFTNITTELRNKFSLEQNIKGILVINMHAYDVKPSLRIGDVVVAINKKAIENINQFDKIYKNLKENGKKSAILLVKRGDFTMFVALPIK